MIPENKAINDPGVDTHSPSAAIVTLSPLFKLVFISVLGITLLCLLLSLYVSIHVDSGAKNVEAMNSLNHCCPS